jgi:hypothetical protein
LIFVQLNREEFASPDNDKNMRRVVSCQENSSSLQLLLNGVNYYPVREKIEKNSPSREVCSMLAPIDAYEKYRRTYWGENASRK